MENQKALEIENLSKNYGSVKALTNLNFSVESGEVFGLLGPNGAGKTSLISIMTTLEEPTTGTIRVFGHDVIAASSKTKPLIGVVTQEIVTHGFFNVEEILNFHSGYYGIANNKDRIHFLLDRLSLFDHRHKKVSQLSGGMKRRLMIAKALVHSPKLLLLDEPTAGVDITLRESLWGFVQELKKQGVTILLTTHYLQEAEALCDRIAVINFGELCCLKPTQEIIRELTRRQVFIELNNTKSITHPYLVEQNNKLLQFVIPSHVQLGIVFREAGILMEDIMDMQVKEGGLEKAMKILLKKK